MFKSSVFKLSPFVLLFFAASPVFSQVKIGDNPDNIDATSILELESTAKVLVLTRLSTSEMQSLTPLKGAMVYNEEEACIFYFNGETWNSLCSTGGGGGGGGGEDIITTMIENANGTYTYTNEAGVETLIAFTGEGGGGGISHLGDVGSVFFADTDGSPIDNKSQFFWNNIDNRLGLGTETPTSTLQVAGSMATNVRFGAGSINLTEQDHTVILNGNSDITLPPANTVPGRIYIIKKRPGTVVNISTYVDSDFSSSAILTSDVTWLQSDSFDWQKIN